MHRTDSATDTSELSRVKGCGGDHCGSKGLDLRVLGVRSGSGLNKLDFAVVHYCQASPDAPLYVDLVKYSQLPVAPSIRNPLVNMLLKARNKPSLLPRINEQLGHVFSNGITAFCQEYDIDLESIDFIGTHTPTLTRIYQQPSQPLDTHPQDWNIVIENQIGLTTAFDFSINQLEDGQSHNSLVAFVDTLLLQHHKKFRACLNIDELVTISFIPAMTEDGHPQVTASYDCGPGSLLIDYATRYCTSNEHHEDYDGKLAAEGKVNQNIVDRFLSTHDHQNITPPLYIAREMFGDHEAQQLIDECLFSNMCAADILATVTRITAKNILKQYHRLFHHLFPNGEKLDELFICGPSARNANIIDFLEVGLPDAIITRPLDDIGIHGDANEAVCCAHLALGAILGQTSHSVNGSPAIPRKLQHDTITGRIARGKNWEHLVERVLTFSKNKSLHLTRNVRVAGNIANAFRELGLQ